MKHIASIILFLFAVGVSGTAGATNEEAAWAALQQGGHVILMRHASAPGPEQGKEGDPPNFRLDDCSTQRNLDEVGRRQAAAIGNAFRAHHVELGNIVTSPWCRAKDTAILMGFAVSMEHTMLLRNLGEREGGAGEANRHEMGPKMAAERVHEIIRRWEGPGNLLMVSHGRMVVNILWGDRRRSPEQAELYVLQPTPNERAPFHIVGSIPSPD